MTNVIADVSPTRKARIAGAFYLATMITGLIAQGFISQRLVTGDATTTAMNITSHSTLYQLGFAVYMIEMACQIVMTFLLYELLKPVSRSVSLLAAVLGLVGCGIKIFSRVFYFAPLLVLGGANYSTVFSASQLESTTLLLRINDLGAGIALIFFGLNAILKGYLVIRSWFLPRALGWLSVVAGSGWLLFLSPPLGNRLFGYIGAIGLVGALANIAWLLIKGVNDQRWIEQARVAETSIWR